MTETEKLCEFCHKRPAVPVTVTGDMITATTNSTCRGCADDLRKRITRYFDEHPGDTPGEASAALLAQHHARDLDDELAKLLGD
jgi:hypothetical protein